MTAAIQVELLTAEFRRYRHLGEKTFAQVTEKQLCITPPDGSSVATIVWHVAGNLESRFTDFLTADGEKPWRDREGEFAERRITREEMMERWEAGWGVVFGTLSTLNDADLTRRITVRGVELRVDEALFRSLAHTAYHIGQIVYLGKQMAGGGWDYLSIPPGGTDEYNANPYRERARDLPTD